METTFSFKIPTGIFIETIYKAEELDVSNYKITWGQPFPRERIYSKDQVEELVLSKTWVIQDARLVGLE